MGGLLKLFMGGMIGDMIGADFEAGLQGLKQRSEGGAVAPGTEEEG
jgi:hypothetical protein